MILGFKPIDFRLNAYDFVFQSAFKMQSFVIRIMIKSHK